MDKLIDIRRAAVFGVLMFLALSLMVWGLAVSFYFLNFLTGMHAANPVDSSLGVITYIELVILAITLL